jgi:hypothetical protein
MMFVLSERLEISERTGRRAAVRKNGHKKAHLDINQVSFLRKRRYIFLFFMIYLFLLMAAVTR